MLALAACDRAPDAVIVPEYEFSWSFDSGMEGWSALSADVGGGGAAAGAVSDQASQGSGSLRLDLTNPGGAAKVWLNREIEVTPDKSYTAVVTFDLRTSEHTAEAAWTLIAGVRAIAPTTAAGLEYQGDTSSGTAGGSGTVWASKEVTVAAQADDEGRLFLTLGVWGTSAGTRSYWIDNVKVVLTRTS